MKSKFLGGWGDGGMGGWGDGGGQGRGRGRGRGALVETSL